MDVNCSDLKGSEGDAGKNRDDGMVGGSIGEIIGGGIDEGSGLTNVDVIAWNDGISLLPSDPTLSKSMLLSLIMSALLMLFNGKDVYDVCKFLDVID